MIQKHNTIPEAPTITASPDVQVDGQLLNDMFLTMAYNLKKHHDGATRNRVLKDRLGSFMPQGGLTFREWGLKLKVHSLVAGSLIMRHGANLYLKEIEDNVPTVSGIVTSINCDVASFCIDPIADGKTDKDREVTVMPVDLRSLQRRVSIGVLGTG